MRADIRLWTAVAIIGICGLSVVQGWKIVHFSLAMANIDLPEKRAETINAWAAVPIVASAALRAELKERIVTSDSKAAEGRREALSSMLSIKPLSSEDWLSLSIMQLAMGHPMEQVTGYLKLSMLTGPNEGYLMTNRGIFGASLWESLSPDLKRRVAVDLAAGDLTGIEKLRGVLAAKPKGVRNEIREAVLETGLAPKEVEQRLGRWDGSSAGH